MSSRRREINGSQFQRRAIRQALDRVLQSARLQQSRMLKKFLRFVVEEDLAGRGAALKQYRIAVGALERDETFDPESDPIVRVEARRLRAVLGYYYDNEGKNDPIRIELPKGRYAPVYRPNAPAEPKAPASEKPVGSEAQGIEGPTLALLDLTAVGGDTGLSDIARGLSEELASALSRFKFIRVVGPIAPGEFASGEPASDLVRRRYGAQFLVKGAVETRRGRLIVTLRLLGCESGRTIWSDRFDLSDESADGQSRNWAIKRMVAEIADFDGAAVRHWAGHALRRGGQIPTKYEALITYRHWITTFDRESYAAATKASLDALARWPKDPLANALAADMLLTGRITGFESEETSLARAEGAARRSVALEPNSQFARFILGKIFIAVGERMPAIAELEEALALNPYSAHQRIRIGLFLCFAGDWRRGAELVEEACALARDNSIARFALGLVRYREGDFDAAWTEAYRINHPRFYWFWAHALRAAILGQLGRREDAAAELEELLRLFPDFRENGRERMRLILFSDENVEMLVDGLRKAGLDIDQRTATAGSAIGDRPPAGSSVPA